MASISRVARSSSTSSAVVPFPDGVHVVSAVDSEVEVTPKKALVLEVLLAMARRLALAALVGVVEGSVVGAEALEAAVALVAIDLVSSEGVVVLVEVVDEEGAAAAAALEAVQASAISPTVATDLPMARRPDLVEVDGAVTEGGIDTRTIDVVTAAVARAVRTTSPLAAETDIETATVIATVGMVAAMKARESAVTKATTTMILGSDGGNGIEFCHVGVPIRVCQRLPPYLRLIV